MDRRQPAGGCATDANGFALCLLVCAVSGPVLVAHAQLLTSLFPEGVPGYGTEQGVTVQSRARPAYDLSGCATASDDSPVAG